MCPFKAGDIVKGPHRGLYWFINDKQYVALELYEYGEREGHQGLYLAGGAETMLWYDYNKICTIDELARVLLKVEL